ncbi:hypothetical protein [Pseudodesulfovibrio sp.]|uniref:hypothetical protein n=1 Tax=unclassified Pseudodesulfovibrio TaxID=2661612 RepID=UPI003B006004
MDSKLLYLDVSEFIERAKPIMTTFAMLACAGVSAYATYEGLAVQVTKGFALLLSFASWIVVLFAAYYAGAKLLKRSSFFMRFFIVVLAFCGILSFSTLWSVVGMAKGQVFILGAAESINNFVVEYSTSGYQQHYASALSAVKQTMESVATVRKNSERGLYTGVAKPGVITKSMTLVEEKLRKAEDFMGQATADAHKFDDAIRTNLTNIQGSIDSLDKKEFFRQSNEINSALASLNHLNGSQMLNESIVALNSVIDILDDKTAEDSQKGRKREVLAAEVKSLISCKERMQDALMGMQFKVTPLSVASVTDPLILQCLKHFPSTFHWWALSVALDVVPFLLMLNLLSRKEGSASFY